MSGFVFQRRERTPSQIREFLMSWKVPIAEPLPLDELEAIGDILLEAHEEQPAAQLVIDAIFHKRVAAAEDQMPRKLAVLLTRIRLADVRPGRALVGYLVMDRLAVKVAGFVVIERSLRVCLLLELWLPFVDR